MCRRLQALTIRGELHAISIVSCLLADFIYFRDLNNFMNRYFYLSLIVICVAVCSCKKSYTTTASGPDAASLKVENQLEVGAGLWHVDDEADTLFDSNNKAVYSFHSSDAAYWEFKKDYWTPWHGSFMVYTYRILNDDSTIDALTYTFSFSNGKTYIVQSATSKAEVTTLTGTKMVWVTPAKDLTYPTGPSSFGTAAYGNITTHFSKYQ